MPISAEEPNPQRDSPAAARTRARTDPFLVTCRCFSVLTALTAILCVFVNVLSAVRSFKNGSDIFGGIFRCYAVVIALFVVVVETEWGFIIKFWRVFEYWAGRGMLQILYVLFLWLQVSLSQNLNMFIKAFDWVAKIIFPRNFEQQPSIMNLCDGWSAITHLKDVVAVMTRAFPDRKGEGRDLVLLQDIASYLLLACGLTYIISGVLCIGFLKRARMRSEITRDQATKDLEELERRKQELEALLVSERV